jgi:hypothetical protein
MTTEFPFIELLASAAIVAFFVGSWLRPKPVAKPEGPSPIVIRAIRRKERLIAQIRDRRLLGKADNPWSDLIGVWGIVVLVLCIAWTAVWGLGFVILGIVIWRALSWETRREEALSDPLARVAGDEADVAWASAETERQLEPERRARRIRQGRGGR